MCIYQHIRRFQEYFNHIYILIRSTTLHAKEITVNKNLKGHEPPIQVYVYVQDLTFSYRVGINNGPHFSVIVVGGQKEMTANKDLKARVGVGVTVVAGVDQKGLGISRDQALVGTNNGPHFSVIVVGGQKEMTADKDLKARVSPMHQYYSLFLKVQNFFFEQKCTFVRQSARIFH